MTPEKENRVVLPVSFFLNKIPAFSMSVNGAAHDYGITPENFKYATLSERKHLFPFLKEAFKDACLSSFDRDKDKVIDIGCGPMLLAPLFLREKVAIDGIEISKDMIAVAKETVTAINSHIYTVDVQETTPLYDNDQLTDSNYGFAMMNFVHTGCKTEECLKNLFKLAHTALKPDSFLVMATIHPENIHEEHAYYKCNLGDRKSLQDGDVYSKDLFSVTGENMYKIQNETFWSRQTLQDIAREAGFNTYEIINLPDDISLTRDIAGSKAYTLMTFKKTAPQVI